MYAYYMGECVYFKTFVHTIIVSVHVQFSHVTFSEIRASARPPNLTVVARPTEETRPSGPTTMTMIVMMATHHRISARPCDRQSERTKEKSAQRAAYTHIHNYHAICIFCHTDVHNVYDVKPISLGC